MIREFWKPERLRTVEIRITAAVCQVCEKSNFDNVGNADLFEPPMKTLWDQNKERNQSVPESVIRKLADKCEPPTWAECHRLVVSDGSA